VTVNATIKDMKEAPMDHFGQLLTEDEGAR